MNIFTRWMNTYQSKQENLVYLALWGILFAAPVLSLYVRSTAEDGLTFQWTDVLMVWRQFSAYLLLFLVHNFLLAPMLVVRRQHALYLSAVAVIIALFTGYQCNTRPMVPEEPTMELRDRPPHLGDDMAPPHFDDEMAPPEPRDPKPQHKMVHGTLSNGTSHRPPAIIGEHDIVAIVVLILMFAANLGLKFYFKTRSDHKRLERIERENLEQQLEYLKYQLNPHFLMNTLNNIHALIDIEPPKAQEAVIQLSKILRYVLYDSNRPLVPMTKEVEFMRNYARLMRMRYTDRLRFTVSQPDSGQGVMVAPLLFISFVENAFKHGVSYQEDSFIDISGKRYTDTKGRERLLWTCRNSKHPTPIACHTQTFRSENTRQGGVGMANVRKRLDLIYGKDYTLGINETDDTYEVILDIPLEHESMKKT